MAGPQVHFWTLLAPSAGSPQMAPCRAVAAWRSGGCASGQRPMAWMGQTAGMRGAMMCPRSLLGGGRLQETKVGSILQVSRGGANWPPVLSIDGEITGSCVTGIS